LKVSIKDPEEGKKELQVEVPPERVEAEVEAAYRRYQRSIQLPGFRKGKVPIEIIKRSHYGRAIREEVLEDLLPKLYEEARKASQIKPISRARIEQVQYEEGEPLKFTASVEVEPEIKITGYKGLQVVKTVHQVTDEEVENTIQQLRERNAVEKSVDRPAKEGDFLLVDLHPLDPNGLPIVGRQIENRILKITEELAPQLSGIKKGQQQKVRFTYPSDFRDPTLAGKEEHYLVKVKEVRERELPALDDEFAKDLGDYSSLDELRTGVRNDLEERADHIAMQRVHSEIIEQLMRKNPFTVPERMIENYFDMFIEELRRESDREIDEEAIRRENRGDVVRRIKSYLILESVAEQEGIEVSDEDLDKEISRIAEARKIDPEQMKGRMIANGRLDDLRSDLRRRKTLDFLVGNAEITEKKV